jgi:hypothetical protein
MLPLCTNVTDLRFFLMAYLIAALMSRFDARSDGFDPNASIVTQIRAHPLSEELLELVRLFGTPLPFKAPVNVLRVLSEYDDVHLLRLPDGARNPTKVSHGPDGCIQIQLLADGHVEATYASPDRGRQGAFQSDSMLLDRFQSRLGKPFPVLLERFFTGQKLLPFDAYAPS